MIETGMIIAGRYEVEKKIGTGGMSDVYKAKDHTLGRCVAIKVLKPEFCEDMNFVSKFRAEAQAAAGGGTPMAEFREKMKRRHPELCGWI